VATATVSARTRPFVGRDSELGFLMQSLRDGEARVVYLHAIAGMGKSALLQVLLERARGDGATVIELDCRNVEPTERGFLEGVGGFDDVRALHEHLRAATAPVVLMLDHYEVFRLLDTWLRQTLVPALLGATKLVLSGRERPVAGWFAVPGFCSVPLAPLGTAEAHALLRESGVGDADAVRLNRIARGHPLALVLASAGVAEHPELALEDAAMTRVVAELSRLYLEDVDDARTRAALEAASVVRRTTASLLAAMLGDGDGSEAVQRLLELPFVEAGRDGLVVHEAVRTAVAEFLRGTNPARYRSLRREAWRALRKEGRELPSTEVWRYTSDALYLIDNPIVHEAFFPSGAQPLAVEPATPSDGPAVSAIARRHEGPEGAALLEEWWDEAPETVSVVRDRDGVVVGFLTLLDFGMLRLPSVTGDPVVASWSRHLREHPLPKGQIALGFRRWLDAEQGERPSDTQAACWLDVKRTYMERRPALRRMYAVVCDAETYLPIVERLGFRPIPEAQAVIDGVEHSSVQLDFGPASVDGWLAQLVENELGLADEPEVDEEARELPIEGRRVALTPLEFGLFNHLRERPGKTVSRRELLSQVWGTDYIGGSNVVDAVVRSLRRKLGPAGVVVETVRGSGYRLRQDWRAHIS
jgi:Transcriptional regulatory protein, C terminal/AAA ATPase domain